MAEEHQEVETVGRMMKKRLTHQARCPAHLWSKGICYCCRVSTASPIRSTISLSNMPVDVLDFLLILLSHDLNNLSLRHLYRPSEHCPIGSTSLSPKFWKALGQDFVPSAHIFFWTLYAEIADGINASRYGWGRVFLGG